MHEELRSGKPPVMARVHFTQVALQRHSENVLNNSRDVVHATFVGRVGYFDRDGSNWAGGDDIQVTLIHPMGESFRNSAGASVMPTPTRYRLNHMQLAELVERAYEAAFAMIFGPTPLALQFTITNSGARINILGEVTLESTGGAW